MGYFCYSLREGLFESSSSLNLLPKVQDQPMRCSVRVALGGPFRNCPLSLPIDEVSRKFRKSE